MRYYVSIFSLCFFLIIGSFISGCIPYSQEEIYSIKSATYSMFKKETIGDVFNSVFDNSKWQSLRGENGERVVQFTGNISKDFHKYVIEWATEDPRKLEKAKRTKAKLVIESLESALKLYYLDNGALPSTEQGLDALIKKPTIGVVPMNWRKEGYLEKGKVPIDPWGNPYIYRSPGEHGWFDLICTSLEDSLAESQVGSSGYQDNYLSGVWKSGDPVKIQITISRDRKSFNYSLMESPSWGGLPFNNILEIIAAFSSNDSLRK